MLKSIIIFTCAIGILNFINACGDNKSASFDTLKKEIVSKLIEARASKTAIPSLKTTYGELTVDQSYEIQNLLANELSKKYGPVAGYKLGYADSAAIKKNGLEMPAYGPLFKNQILKNGGVVPVKDFRKFSIENEVVFKVGKLIDKPVRSLEELRPYIKSVSVGYDMSEGIFEGGSTAQDFIANGAGSKYFMTGPDLDPDKIDLTTLMLTVTFENQVVYKGASSIVLGNPWYAMLAMANDLQKRGLALKEGDLIFSGKVDAAYKRDNDKALGIYYGDGGSLGQVQCEVR